MTGPVLTRIVLYVTLLALMAWEGWVILKFGKPATISVVIGELFRDEPLLLAGVVLFLAHCVIAARP